MVERPPNLSAQQAAGSRRSLRDRLERARGFGRFAAGQWALVAGAAGAVGIAAVSLARALGGHAIGLVRPQTDVSALRELGAEIVRSDGDALAENVRSITGGRGVDVALNGVGASLFPPLAASLVDGGRMIVYSVIGGREAQLDLFALYRRQLELFGLDTASLDLAQIRTIYEALTPLFASGTIAPPRIVSAVPLSKHARRTSR